MKLIGISGKIGTGKTYLTSYTLDLIKGTRMSFGDPVKEEVSALFDFPCSYCYDQEKKKLSVSVPETVHVYDKDLQVPNYPKATIRELLQWWGTEIRRAHEPNYWIDAMRKKIQQSKAPVIIIDDVRFPNEAALIQELNGYLIRLNPYQEWECDPGIASHSSETGLDTFTEWNMNLTPGFGTLKAQARMLSKVITWL